MESTFTPADEAVISIGTAFVLRNVGAGRHLDVENTDVQVRWDDAGDWQCLMLYDGGAGAGSYSLVAHTGCFLESIEVRRSHSAVAERATAGRYSGTD